MLKATNLIVSHGHDKIDMPYTFEETSVSVYSIEEAFYHIYHHYKESLNDLTSGSLAIWIEKELKLPIISNLIIKTMNDNNSLTDKLIKILSYIDYFDEDELSQIKSILYSYENQTLWIKKKQTADKLFLEGKYISALKEYKDITHNIDEPLILNNMGLCYLHLYEYKPALLCFLKALKIDKQHNDIAKNYVIALALAEEYDSAIAYLDNFNSDDPNIIKIHCEILIHKKDYKNATQKLFFLVDTEYMEYAYISISNCYLMLNNISKALEWVYPLETEKKVAYYRQMAKISEKTGKLTDAAAYLQKAMFASPDDYITWQYYAEINYKLKEYMKCHGSALKAMRLDGMCELPYYTIARVKKDTLKQGEYKQNISKIVDKWLQVL